MTPRGIRNNNPGNIRKGENWDGLDRQATEQEPDFCVFTEAKWGVRALCRLLLTYFRRDGLQTVEEIIRKYAPAQENDTRSYIADVCQRTGFQAQEKLCLSDRRVMMKLIKAIIWHENGALPYEDKELSVGMRLTGL